MRMSTFLFLGFCIVFLLSSCSAQTPTPAPIPEPSATLLPTVQPTTTPTATPTPRPFRVIGYATASMIVEIIPFDKLTHINYAFLIPNADGTFIPLNNAWKIKSLVQRSHQSGVKVLISIGGWGWEKQFAEMAADPEKRATFVREALKVVAEFDFDGIDIDWEYPQPGESADHYLLLIQELRAALPEKLLTTAVISYGDETGLGIPAASFELLDFINVMTYDGSDHASLQQFQTGLDYWLDRGVPADKLVMGIPFYSRPGEIPYRKLVETDPAAAQSNTTTYNGQEQRYNGLPLVQEKTRLAVEKASGIMFWTLEQDTQDALSLLAAIYETATSQRP